MKTHIIIAICFIILLSHKATAEEEISIAIGEWHPFIGKDLPHYGIVTHILTTIFTAQNISVRYGFFPWKRSYKYVKSGKWHASAIWGKTKERLKDCYFSDIVYTGELVLFHLRETPIIWQGDPEKLYQLKGLHIGIPMESAKAKLLVKAEQAKLINFITGTDKVSTFRMLVAKRFDALDENKDVGLHIIHSQLTTDHQDDITYTQPYERWDYHLIFSKKIEHNKLFLKLFNEGLNQLVTTGQYQQLWKEFYQGKYN
ncbi:substrate-binding periplasmic protein [Zooshikella ganghwensis]|uniref:Amino acid ABC transporter substrate-binding protein n=1 Tax=Zooshikella ganghwensis TaxID=202772 RepID=A0A4P9VK61_9GAMM|nr:transporter substrate-binding domain-containing protein [Zooshikella ganghwensis]RDH42724.1 amino acid ABC transporter substrate-binding protein [Zooshikella ganghwensis]